MMVFVFLDYDGTLTPIVRTPGKARLSSGGRAALRTIAKKRGFKLAVVSGRPLDDLMRRVGIKEAYYVGNHGMEIAGPGMRRRTFSGIADKRMIAAIASDLARSTGGIKGAMVENKIFTVSLHYRLVKNTERGRLKKLLSGILRPYQRGGRIRLTQGKMVFDIRPSRAPDKGTAVTWLLKRFAQPGVYPVYIGDDTTDEDAFKALRGRGMTIRVGRSAAGSHAQYFLKNSAEVLKFITRIGRIEHEPES